MYGFCISRDEEILCSSKLGQPKENYWATKVRLLLYPKGICNILMVGKMASYSEFNNMIIFN